MPAFIKYEGIDGECDDANHIKSKKAIRACTGIHDTENTHCIPAITSIYSGVYRLQTPYMVSGFPVSPIVFGNRPAFRIDRNTRNVVEQRVLCTSIPAAPGLGQTAAIPFYQHLMIVPVPEWHPDGLPSICWQPLSPHL